MHQPPGPRVQRARSWLSARHEPLTHHPLGGLLAALLMVLGAVAPLEAEKPIVVAERHAYCSPGIRTEIYSSGVAHQHVWDTCQGLDKSQLVSITKRQIKSIESAVVAARFCDLPSHLKKPSTSVVSGEHDDFLSIKVGLGTTECDVGAGENDLDELADQIVAERFRKVWSAITAVVPEPTE